MRRHLIIGLLLAFGLSAGLLAWRPWKLNPEKWVKQTMEELKKATAPSPALAQSFQSKQWAGHGYLIFSNGWARFSYHSIHDTRQFTKPFDDIAFLRSSDGAFYRSSFHFCDWEGVYYGQPQPHDIEHFIQLYEKSQNWTRIHKG